MRNDGQTHGKAGLSLHRMLMSAIMTGILTVSGAKGAWAFGAFPSHVPVPADNPTTPAKIALGKELFFDPRISLSGTVSCDSCHNLAGNGTDNLAHSFGIFGRLSLPRNAPTVFNAAFNTVQFWDGRAKSLEQQVAAPPLNPAEMGMPSKQAVVDRLRRIPGYRKQFAAVFGAKNAVTFQHVEYAIATFERTLITPNSAYDRYVNGDRSALSADALKGMALFRSTGCSACHAGPLFDNPGTPMGTGWYQKFPAQPTYPPPALTM